MKKKYLPAAVNSFCKMFVQLFRFFFFYILLVHTDEYLVTDRIQKREVSFLKIF